MLLRSKYSLPLTYIKCIHISERNIIWSYSSQISVFRTSFGYAPGAEVDAQPCLPANRFLSNLWRAFRNLRIRFSEELPKDYFSFWSWKRSQYKSLAQKTNMQNNLQWVEADHFSLFRNTNYKSYCSILFNCFIINTNYYLNSRFHLLKNSQLLSKSIVLYCLSKTSF